MNKSRLLGAVYTFLCLYSINGSTATVAYDISWTGANGYSMTGDFSFDDSILGGLIIASDVSSLSIEGFLNGLSVGSFIGLPITFNFDSATELFVVGPSANCSGDGGQIWGDITFCGGSPGFAFAQGSSTEGLYVNGVWIESSTVPISETTLFATRQPAVPIPPALWLFGSGLLGLVGLARRKTAK